MDHLLNQWSLNIEASFQRIDENSFLEYCNNLPIDHTFSFDDIDLSDDLIYFKLNHGFWELNALNFSTKARSLCNLSSRPFLNDYHEKVLTRFIDNGFLATFISLCRNTYEKDFSSDALQDKQIKRLKFGVSVWDGIFPHNEILTKLKNKKNFTSNMSNMAFNATCTLNAWSSALSHTICFVDGCLPKLSLKNGSLERLIKRLQSKSVSMIAVVPPHLKGLSLDGDNSPQIKKIVISPVEVHQQWPSLLQACHTLVESTLLSGKDCVMLVQAASISALLAVYLNNMLNILPTSRGKLIFLDLGQALDACSSQNRGKWLSRKEFMDVSSLFVIR